MNDRPLTRHKWSRLSALQNAQSFEPLARAYKAHKAAPENRSHSFVALVEMVRLCRRFGVNPKWHRTLVELGRLDNLAQSDVKLAVQKRSPTSAMKAEAEHYRGINGPASTFNRRWRRFCRVLIAIEDQRQTQGTEKLEMAFKLAAQAPNETLDSTKADYHFMRKRTQARGASKVRFHWEGKLHVVRIPNGQ